MKDLNGLTHSFPDWNAVLDFLAGVTPTRDIHITKKGMEGWTARINGTNVKCNAKPKATSGVALYDLYW